MTTLNFDATGFEKDANNFEPLPEGVYKAIIIDSERKKARSGRGDYLNLTFEIIDSEKYKGRKLWEILNLWNDNPVAVDIANQTLANICYAVEVLNPKESEELFHKELFVKVGQETYDAGYGKMTKNVIRSFMPLNNVTGSPVNTNPEKTDRNEDLPF